MSTESISRRLSCCVAGLAFEDLPPEVLDRARGVTLQGLSSCLLGHDFPETKQAVRLVEDEEQGSAGVGEHRYAALVTECGQIDQVGDLTRLIALTCPTRTSQSAQ